MTDRANALVVELDRDIMVDDLEPLIAAIKMFKYVVSVQPNVLNPGDYLAYSRARRELEQRLFDALKHP